MSHFRNYLAFGTQSRRKTRKQDPTPPPSTQQPTIRHHIINLKNDTNINMADDDAYDHVATALLSLRCQCLQTLEWTNCDLENDAGLAVLVGGLLALKDTLEEFRLEATGLHLTRNESLPLIGHLLTELPHLDTLELQFQNCPGLLSSSSPQSNNDKNDKDALQVLGRALHDCTCESLKLQFFHAGCTEDSVLQLLQSAGGFGAGKLSLAFYEWNLVHTESFVNHLAKLVQYRFHCVQELILVNTSCTTAAAVGDQQPDVSWSTPAKQESFAETLYCNASLQSFDLRIINNQHVDFRSIVETMVQLLRTMAAKTRGGRQPRQCRRL
jgi:hypothetical protein